jgi:ATP-dependent helicase/nuclease subunit B
MPVVLRKNFGGTPTDIDEEVKKRLRADAGSSFFFVAPTRRKVRELQREFLHHVPGNIAPAFYLFTLETLAQSLCKLMLPPRRAVSGPAQALLVHQAIQRVQSLFKYFRTRGAAGKLPKGTFQKIISVLNSLKEQGAYRSALLTEIDSADTSEQPKLLDLLAISEEYEKLLGGRFIDAGGFYQHLNFRWDERQCGEIFKKAFPDVTAVFVSGFDEFSPPELTMLHNLSELSGVGMLISFDYHLGNDEVFGHLKENYQKFLEMGFTKVSVPELPATSFHHHIMKHLFQKQLPKGKLPCRDTVTLMTAPNRQEEVALIAKLIKRMAHEQPGIDLSRICVAVHKPELYTNLFREVFQEYGVPANITDRYYLDQSRLVIAILSLLAVQQGNFRLKDIMRALSSPYFDFSGYKTVPDAGNLYKVATQLKITVGRQTWTTRIERRLKMLATEIANEQDAMELPQWRREEESLRKAASDIETLRSVLAPFDQPMRPLQFKEQLTGILDSLHIPEQIVNIPEKLFGYEHLEKDGRAYQKFVSFLDDFLEILSLQHDVDGAESLGYYLDQLRAALSQIRYNIRQRYGYGVAVTSMDETRGIHFDVMILAGLIDGEFPTVYQPEILFSSTRRERKERYHLHEHRYLFYQALTNFSKHVYLLYPKTDDETELVPSSFIRGVLDVIEPDDRRDTLNTEFSETVFSRDELLQHIGASIGADATYLPVLPSALKDDITGVVENIRRAVAVERSRTASHALAEFDGIIGAAISDEARNALNQFRTKVYSVTQLETYGKCPFQFFADKVLRLNAPPEMEEGLSALEKGGVLHEVLFEFYSSRREKNLPPLSRVTDKEFQEALDDLRHRLVTKLAQWDFTDLFWEVEKENILGTQDRKGILREFLEREREDTLEIEPKYFEVGFGSKVGAVSDPALHRKEPVVAGKVLLRGKVDRIDGDNRRFRIIDYKTGANLASWKEIEEGISLQLPLYLYAVESIFSELREVPQQGVAGIYYSLRSPVSQKLGVGSKEHRDQIFSVKRTSSALLDSDERLREVIQRAIQYINVYVDAITAGSFPVQPKDPAKVCKSCSFNTVCRIQTMTAISQSEES